VIDPLAVGVGALAAPSPSTVGMLFAAGAITSVGPCVAPRYIAIAALASRDRQPLRPIFAFVAGLIGTFIVLGASAGLVGSLWRISLPAYGLLAAGLLVGGCITLIRAVPPPLATGCCPPRAAQRAKRTSLGGTFLLGAANALVISPCCTPIVAGLVGAATAIGKPAIGIAFLTSFALGHALPLVFAGAASTLLRRALTGPRAQAPAIVGGSLMLALGAYYAVLA
jgi:cytochrome c-type biogenesis protein